MASASDRSPSDPARHEFTTNEAAMNAVATNGTGMTRTRMILAMILTYGIFAVLLNSVGTLILQSQISLGASRAEASVLDAYKDLPIAIVSFLVASWLPRFGYRRAMMTGLLLVAIACVGMLAMNAFWMVKLLLAASGVAFALVKVSVYAAVGLLTDGRRAHASLTSTIEGWFMVGVLAGPWLFGAFIQRQRTPDDPVWLQVYAWLAVACVAAIALLATVRMDEARARDGSGSFAAFVDMLRLALRPLVAVFVISAFLYVLIEQSIGTWLPTFNADILHLSTATSVEMASLFAAFTALGRLTAGQVLRRVPWHLLLSVCVVSAALLMLLVLPLATAASAPAGEGWRHAPLAAFALPAIGFFLAPIYPAINSVVLSALPASRHAAMTGLIVVFSALGGSTGSYVTGQVFASTGGEAAFHLTLLPMGLLLVGILWLHRLSGTRDERSSGARSSDG